jgi:transposase-like protein
MIRWGFLFQEYRMHELSAYQRRVLLKNSNVEKITERNVIYTSKFKIRAVQQHLQGKNFNEIFNDAGIDPKYFKKDYCRLCLKRWKKKYFEEGKHSLKISNTGKKATGRPKLVDADELTVEELRALVEIQQEMIVMLKKNRALAMKKKVK